MWQSVIGLTGGYIHPVLLNLFWVVVLIQVGVMVWGLRQTAAEGRTYGGQVGAGTLMSVFGGVIIFCGSLLFTTVLFPHYCGISWRDTTSSLFYFEGDFRPPLRAGESHAESRYWIPLVGGIPRAEQKAEPQSDQKFDSIFTLCDFA